MAGSSSPVRATAAAKLGAGHRSIPSVNEGQLDSPDDERRTSRPDDGVVDDTAQARRRPERCDTARCPTPSDNNARRVVTPPGGASSSSRPTSMYRPMPTCRVLRFGRGCFAIMSEKTFCGLSIARSRAPCQGPDTQWIMAMVFELGNDLPRVAEPRHQSCPDALYRHRRDALGRDPAPCSAIPIARCRMAADLRKPNEAGPTS